MTIQLDERATNDEVKEPEFVLEIPMGEIDADPSRNLRGRVDPLSIKWLIGDIAKNGMMTPVSVTKAPEGHECPWILVAGFCRHMAHVALGKETIRALELKNVKTDLEINSANFRENIQRTNLTLYQEAKALEPFLKTGMGDWAVAEEIGQSRGWVQVRMMLLELPPEIQELAKAKMLTTENIRHLKTIKDKEGVAACFEAAKYLKTAKEQGKRVKLLRDRPRKEVSKKQPRTHQEIRGMQDHIYDTIGPNIATRFSAWALGVITDDELYYTIKGYADMVGKAYTIPIRGELPSVAEDLAKTLAGERDGVPYKKVLTDGTAAIDPYSGIDTSEDGGNE